MKLTGRALCAIVGGGLAYLILAGDPAPQVLAAHSPADVAECAEATLLFHRTMATFDDVADEAKAELARTGAALTYLAADRGRDAATVERLRHAVNAREWSVFGSREGTLAERLQSVTEARSRCLQHHGSAAREAAADPAFATFAADHHLLPERALR